MLLGSLSFALGVWRRPLVLIYCLAAVPAGMGFGISQHLPFRRRRGGRAGEPAHDAIALVIDRRAGRRGPWPGDRLERSQRGGSPAFSSSAPTLTLLVPAGAGRACLLVSFRLPPAPPRHGIPRWRFS